MKSHLSVQDKASLIRLYDHAGENLISVLIGNIELGREIDSSFLPKAWHVSNLISGSGALSKSDVWYQDEVSTAQVFMKVFQPFHQFFNDFSSENNCDFEVPQFPFRSRLSALYIAVFSLFQNCLSLVPEGDLEITISGRNVAQLPDSVTWTRDFFGIKGMPFYRISVQDNGSGFDKSRPLTDYLQRGVSTRKKGRGSGLHFVRMACQYLQAPLLIESQPGNTTISIYHPMGLEEF